ncbi:hypothetical protein G6K91_31595 [Agrobacterium rhizogenes]|nr:hypothetical protein [Rhizobium rhizogenes]NTG58592.1 hypothetical protein [Rhizobium rhizogenes]
MQKIVFIAVAILVAAPSLSFAGNCDHSYQRASDGSSCGGRADDQKTGGKY